MSHYFGKFKIFWNFHFIWNINVLNHISHAQAGQIDCSLFHFYFIMLTLNPTHFSNRCTCRIKDLLSLRITFCPWTRAWIGLLCTNKLGINSYHNPTKKLGKLCFRSVNSTNCANFVDFFFFDININIFQYFLNLWKRKKKT